MIMAGAIDFGLVNPNNANALAMGFQQSQDRSNALQDRAALMQQHQMANRLADLQYQGALQSQQDSNAERAAYMKGGDIMQNLTSSGLGKQALSYGKAQMEQQTAKMAQAKGVYDLTKAATGAVMAQPTLANATAALTRLGQLTGTDVSRDLAEVQSYGEDPAKIKAWAAGHSVDADKLLPKFETIDKGATKEHQGFDPLTGAPIGAPTVFQVSATPSAVLQSDTSKRNADLRHQDAMARLNQEIAVGVLKPETRDFLAQMYIQTGTVPPLGFGKGAAKMKQDVLDRAAAIATSGGVSAADAAGTVKTNKAELAGTTAGQRAIGTQQANISMASTELEKMIPIAESYVAKVNPTDYPIVNKFGNFIAQNTGDPNIVGLATALNSLVNVYARAINPKGMPTISDKDHAREIVEKAMASGQLSEAFKVMRKESGAAKEAGPEVKASMRPVPTAPSAAAGTWGKAVAE